MMNGTVPNLPINTLLQPRQKYVFTKLLRQDLEQMHIVMRQAAMTLRK